MDEISLLIGGKAGFGIDTSSLLIGRILNQLGFRIHIYRDYPSLIRGGHTFSIIRAAKEKIATHRNKVDFLLALNQDTVDFHKDTLKDNSIIIYDSDTVKSEGHIGVPVGKIIKEENASEIMRNSCIIGGFSKAAGIEWDVLEQAFRKNISREIEINLKVALRGFNEARKLLDIGKLEQEALPILTG
ncbi:MAG: 2-oxoacid:acceptor oxidoreductase family protein, partial [Candidatus Omnitrophica bacterium]|nr:2-oxoacid:acceptor oxidoreductase family protein [Candidatus Omnitrophota bacterium]